MPVPEAHGLHRRALLRDDVYTSIRDAIVDGTLAPGERIRDVDLVDWLGVSRTPIREAFLRLERAGLLESRPGHSTIVTPIDDARTRNAEDIAAALHALAMSLAGESLAEEDLTEMERANTRFAEAMDAGDIAGALSADDAFHAVALRASGNPRLADLLEEVAPLVRRVERLRFASLTGRDSVAQHALIVELCRAGDVRAATEATHRNWQTLGETPRGVSP
ncbi:GntR family transcriptional regulator [Microbacterium betulae]|uniref:GntR family transcriptional regulator n=1 Tax=Microbacterium betulae TaxID=2981139 RepID=A0AA97FFV8_9MICO|nr:GntR family transcriptional regulator [Microbacterium sp. AB]WOF22418.1 GntR family transcriptional regulator [Microbacterium sp. AB]